MPAQTPMMRQWSQIKQQYPDCIVLFRLGDFYEAFNADAEHMAEICDVVLTSRPVKKGERAPMAGVPYHAVDGYIAQMVRAGRKVAIVEQVGEDTSPEKRARMSRVPAPAAPAAESVAAPAEQRRSGRGIMEREVVRVVTPGTLVEGDLLESGAHNFLVALVPRGPRVGLAYADATTGLFETTELSGSDVQRQLLDEMLRLRPAEIIYPDRQDAAPQIEQLRASLELLGLGTVLLPFAAWRFDAENARRALLEHFGTASLAAYGCEELPEASAAAGAVLAYLIETQRGAARQIVRLASYSSGSYMQLDAATRRNLELSVTLRGDKRRGSLLSVLDRSRSPMGARTLRGWIEQPLLNRERIEARLDAVELLLEKPALRETLREALAGAGDIERLVNRGLAGYAGPRELLRLAAGLRSLSAVGSALTAAASREPADATGDVGLAGLCQQDVLPTAEALEAAIDPETPASLGAAGVIRRGYWPELDAIHDSVADARAWIAGLEAVERERSGVKGLKVGYNKVFGYYLQVPKSAAAQVPEDYHRKQTVTHGERYITPELKAREREVLGAETRIVELERELFARLLGMLAEAAPLLLEAAGELGRIDALQSLAESAAAGRYTRPEIDEGRALDIRGGRHPVVEVMRPAEPFVPNDLAIGEGEIVLLTGPNMAGKSTVGRQAALICLMAQIGSFVPARSARIGLVDRIFTRIGAQDEIAAGQSTFMVEMVEMAGILNHASPRSLIVLDELGRGTSTYDGMSIAWSVVEHIHNHPGLGARTLFATHYHELTVLEELLPRVRNLHLAVAETDEGIAFLHEVRPGAADRSYGIHVAQLAGLPKPVIGRAWAILDRLEREGEVPLQAASGRPAAATSGQLPLFSPAPAEHPVLTRLLEIDVDQLSPLEALTLLYELRREAAAED